MNSWTLSNKYEKPRLHVQSGHSDSEKRQCLINYGVNLCSDNYLHPNKQNVSPHPGKRLENEKSSYQRSPSEMIDQVE
jgi:hypothetical protein